MGSQRDDAFAHSENAAGKKEPVIDHLAEVARLAGEFASVWGAGEAACAAGWLHDLGKYAPLFQQVLKREQVMVDHATPGALALLERYRNDGIAAALAVQGHHEGLGSGTPRDLQCSVRMSTEKSVSGRTYSCRDTARLLQRLVDDGGRLPTAIKGGYPSQRGAVADMLSVRMLFSALTDADFLATEAHFKGSAEGMVYRSSGHTLGPDACLEKLRAFRARLERESTASSVVQALRSSLFEACLSAGEQDPGLFTLTAPTGTGKTLSTLAFALKHAATHKLRRIIVVLPFLSLIEQTAHVYREVLANTGTHIIEDHSLVEYDSERESRLLAENWDAPLILTTTVKFFESLFANRSSACRHLHNIANSVVIFDEAQSMPPHLAVPSLAAIAELCSSYGCSVVFSTATQPAFDSLQAAVQEFSAAGWHTREIAPPSLNLFSRAERVHTRWWREPLSSAEVASRIAENHQCLAVVNLKRNARTLYESVRNGRADSAFHLSTNMCPAHRLDTLSSVKQRLNQGFACHLVSTQCIEAGVDLDFPTVWRALGPLESIIQAAGRCNRNGRLEAGSFNVFVPVAEDEHYPGTDYMHGAVQVKLMLAKASFDLHDPKTVRAYYQAFFAAIQAGKRNEPLQAAIKALSFQEVARLYRWIQKYSVSVLVPYSGRLDEFHELSAEARQSGLSKSWTRRAGPLAVGAILRQNSRLLECLEPIRDKQRQETGWYILLNPDLYSPELGLSDVTDTDAYFVV